MCKRAVNAAALVAALLIGSSLALAQRPASDKGPRPPEAKPKLDQKPAAKSLADLLAEALKSNPDIRVAEAKLQEASAELERSRLKVTQKVVAAYHGLQAQKAEVAAAEAGLARAMQLFKTGARAISKAELDAARQQLLLAKAKLAALEAELPYLLGKQALQKEDKALAERYRRLLYLYNIKLAQRAWGDEETVVDPLTRQRFLRALQPPRGTVADKLKKALDKAVPLKFEKMPLNEVLQFLEDKVKGVSFHIVSSKRGMEKKLISLDLKEVPLGAAIQAIQDSAPGLRFVVRDYGVLVTWENKLPPRALLLEDFWKGAAAKEKPAPKN
jgi:hypothetical protein